MIYLNYDGLNGRYISSRYLYEFYDTIDKITHWSHPYGCNNNMTNGCIKCYQIFKDVALEDYLDDRLYFIDKYPYLMFDVTYYSHIIGIDICSDSLYLENISTKDSLLYVTIFREEIIQKMIEYSEKKHIPDSIVYLKNTQ